MIITSLVPSVTSDNTTFVYEDDYSNPEKWLHDRYSFDGDTSLICLEYPGGLGAYPMGHNASFTYRFRFPAPIARATISDQHIQWSGGDVTRMWTSVDGVNWMLRYTGPFGTNEYEGTLTDGGIKGATELHIKYSFVAGGSRSMLDNRGSRLNRFRLEVELQEEVELNHAEVVVRGPPPSEPKVGNIEGYLLVRTPTLIIWNADPMIKIPPDELLSLDKPVYQLVELAAARGEYECFQLVVEPRQEGTITGVEVRANDLISADGEKIPAERILARRIGYVNDTFPDVLIPMTRFAVKGGRNNPIWVSVQVPRGIPAGEYKGIINIVVGGSEYPINLTVTVWDFDIPEKTHCGAGLMLVSHDAPNWYGFDKRDPHYQPLIEAAFNSLASHRFVHSDPMPWRWRDYSRFEINPVSEETLADFDHWAQYWIDRGLDFGLLSHYGNPTVSREEYYRVYTQHLQERGWLDKAYCRHKDEPDGTDALVIDVVRQDGEFFAEHAPGLRRLATLAGFHPNIERLKSCLGYVDIWAPNPCPYYTHPEIAQFFIERAQNPDEEVWWYIHNYIGLAYPGIRHRIFFWQMLKYGANGCVLWDTTPYSGARVKKTVTKYWPGEKIDAEQQIYSGSIWHGHGAPLFWPGEDERLLETVRLELFREGMEDFEYHYALRELLAEAEKMPPNPALPRSIEQARKALSLPDKLVTDINTYTDNPEDIQRARRELAMAILALKGAMGKG